MYKFICVFSEKDRAKLQEAGFVELYNTQPHPQMFVFVNDERISMNFEKIQHVMTNTFVL